jgi:hypothetical protein
VIFSACINAWQTALLASGSQFLTETRTSQGKGEKSGARRVILWILFRAFRPLLDELQRVGLPEKHKFAFSQILSFCFP